jgi:hypothetical protein
VDIDASEMISAGKRRSSYGLNVAILCAMLMLFTVCLVQAGDGRSLITQRCLGCHGIEKNCEITTSDPDWWKETVLRMVEYKSDLLSDDEADRVALFLADEQQRATLCTSN